MSRWSRPMSMSRRPDRRLPTRYLATRCLATRWYAGAWRAAAFPLATGLVLVFATSCGSVGPKNEDAGSGGAGGAIADASSNDGDTATGMGTGGGSTGGANGAGGAGMGGAIAVDAGGDVAGSDGSRDGADAGPVPVSCQQIKQNNPSAVSGVFTIAPLGVAQSVFCEMTVDNGGWTAFFVGDNGTPPAGAHFENAADACPHAANRCIRRLPTNIDVTREFAVKCGASVVKFNLGALSLDYLKNGLQHGWQPLSNAVTIDVGVVGKANLIGSLWTGEPANFGWIVAGNINTPTSAFANGYTTNASWNYCNGSTQPDNSSRVMLFYR